VKWSAIRTGLRDVLGTVMGAYTLYTQTQAPPERVNLWLILAGVGLLSAPGAIGLFSLFRGNGATPDTPLPPSRSPSRSSSRR